MRRLLVVLLMLSVASTAMASLTGNTRLATAKAPGTGTPSGPNPDPNSRIVGDTIAQPFVVTALPFTQAGTTVGFFHDYDEVCPFPGSLAPDVVFAYTPAAGVTCVTLDLCYSSYDTKLFVYDNAYTPGAPYACDEDFHMAAPCYVYTSKIESMAVTVGHTYYIVVDGYGSASGAYQLDITNCGSLPLQGACCSPGGSCTVTSEVACAGTWQGENTPCSPNPCPQPANAMMLTGINASITSFLVPSLGIMTGDIAVGFCVTCDAPVGYLDCDDLTGNLSWPVVADAPMFHSLGLPPARLTSVGPVAVIPASLGRAQTVCATDVSWLGQAIDSLGIRIDIILHNINIGGNNGSISESCDPGGEADLTFQDITTEEWAWLVPRLPGMLATSLDQLRLLHPDMPTLPPNYVSRLVAAYTQDPTKEILAYDVAADEFVPADLSGSAQIRILTPSSVPGSPEGNGPSLRISAVPSPSSGPVAIGYRLGVATPVTVEIYTVTGTCLRRFAQDLQTAGEHNVVWDALDEKGHRVPAGVYPVRVTTRQGAVTGRIVLVQ